MNLCNDYTGEGKWENLVEFAERDNRRENEDRAFLGSEVKTTAKATGQGSSGKEEVKVATSLTGEGGRWCLERRGCGRAGSGSDLDSQVQRAEAKDPFFAAGAASFSPGRECVCFREGPCSGFPREESTGFPRVREIHN